MSRHYVCKSRRIKCGKEERVFEMKKTVQRMFLFVIVMFSLSMCSFNIVFGEMPVGENKDRKQLTIDVYERDLFQFVPHEAAHDVIVHGTTNYPGARVVVSYGIEYSTISDEKGEFSINLGKANAATFFSIWATVENSNITDADVIGSKIYSFEIVALNVSFPSVKLDGVDALTTKSKEIKVRCKDEKGNLQVMIDGVLHESQAYEADSFIYRLDNCLKVGTEVSVRVVPETYTMEPSDYIDIIVQLQKATAKKIKAKAKKITGIGYAGSKVKIYKGKKLLGKAACTKKGKYAVKVKKSKLLKKGAKIKLISTAKAKGELYKSEATVKVK